MKTSIVKRGKFIHDDIVCQDALPPPIDLTTPQAMNVIACKSPDGTTSLSTCDSEILQSDARMMYQPCKTCHAQMDPYSRVLQNFGPIGNYRTVDEAGRPIDPSVTFDRARRWRPRWSPGAQPFGAGAGVERRDHGTARSRRSPATRIGNMIRTYNTCEVNDIRARRRTARSRSLFKTGRDWPISCAPRTGGAK